MLRLFTLFVLAMAGIVVVAQEFADDTPIIIGDGSFFIESPRMKFRCWDDPGAGEIGHRDAGGKIQNIRILKAGRIEYDGGCPAGNCRIEIDYGSGKSRLMVIPRRNGRGLAIRMADSNGFRNWRRATDYRQEFDPEDHLTRISAVTLGRAKYCNAGGGYCRVEILYRPAVRAPAECN